MDHFGCLVEAQGLLDTVWHYKIHEIKHWITKETNYIETHEVPAVSLGDSLNDTYVCFGVLQHGFSLYFCRVHPYSSQVQCKIFEDRKTHTKNKMIEN